MDRRQQVAANAAVGFLLAAGLALVVGEAVPVAVGYGLVAAAGFALAIALISRFDG